MKRNVFKTIIASMLIIAQIMCMVVYAYADVPDSRGKLLINMGIADEESYSKDETVSRIRFIDMVLKMLDVNEKQFSKGTEQLFFDVSNDDENYKTAYLAVMYGLVKGGADGYLRPNSPVTKDEALTIIARAIKGEELVQECGGIVNFAIKLDLSDRVNYSDNDTITYKNAVELLYNALCAPSVEKLSNDSYRVNDEGSYMGVIHHIEYAKGILDGNYKQTLFDESAEEYGYITVDGIRYRVKNELYNENYFGMNVTVYYTEDNIGNREIVYIDASNNNTIELDAGCIESYNGQILRYTDTNSNKVKELRVSSSVATIQNGVKISVSDLTQLPQHGTFKLIDHNLDRIYDVVSIESYEIRAVLQISQDKKSLYFINSDKAVNTDDYENIYVTDADGNAIELSALQKYDVAEITEAPNKRYIRIRVVRQKVTFTVSSIMNSEEGYMTLKDEEGKEYRTTVGFSDKITPGKSYEFALDSKGYLAAIVTSEVTSTYTIGYVAGVSLSGVFDVNATVRIYDTEGKFNDYVIDEEVRYANENRKMTAEEAADKLQGELIRFSAKGKTLSQIELASENKNYDGLRRLATLPDTKSIASRYYSSTALLGGKFGVDTNTVIMMVPSDDKAASANGYRIANNSILMNQQYYPNSIGYKVGNDGFNADVVVIKGLSATLNKDSGLMLVSEISDAIEPMADEIKIKFKGFISGTEQELFLDNRELCTYTSAQGDEVKVEAGDMIRYAIDYKNEICDLKLIYDCSEDRIYGNGDTEDASASYGDAMVHRKGQVLRKGGMYLSLLLAGETEESGYLYPVTSGTRLYQVTNTHNGKEFKVITINDIATLENDSNLKDRFFAYMVYQTMQALVIYN